MAENLTMETSEDTWVEAVRLQVDGWLRWWNDPKDLEAIKPPDVPVNPGEFAGQTKGKSGKRLRKGAPAAGATPPAGEVPVNPTRLPKEVKEQIDAGGPPQSLKEISSPNEVPMFYAADQVKMVGEGDDVKWVILCEHWAIYISGGLGFGGNLVG